MKARAYIIGCGGVGSWLAPSLCLLDRKREIIAVDGDRLEEKNLNRQLFRSDEVGAYKAQALAAKYGCGFLNQWFSPGAQPVDRRDWLLVCADNHPARRMALDCCDIFGCQAITACNETYSAEAFYYRPDWRGTGCDPRVYYPEILRDNTGDPRAAAIGCTGEAQERTPQLVTANYLAAGLAQHLYVLWALEWPKMRDETVFKHLPFRLESSLSRLGCTLIGDVKPNNGETDNERNNNNRIDTTQPAANP